MNDKILSIDLGKLHIFITLESDEFYIEDFIPRFRLQKYKPYHPLIAKGRVRLYWQRFEASWYFRDSWIWGIKVLRL